MRESGDAESLNPAALRQRGVIVGFALLVLVFLWDFRLLDPQNFIGGYDVRLGHYWYKSYLQERLRALSLPLWAPQFFSGHPFLAYPEMCVFYPSTILFVLLPVTLAFTVNYALHLLIAGLGARALTRLFIKAPGPGEVSGVCYAFGGYMADRLESGHISYIQSAAVLPWVAYAFHRALQSGGSRDRVIAALLFALLVLASPPHNAMYGVVLMGMQTLVAVVRTRGLRPLLGLGVVLALGMLASAAQVLPTMEFARLTDRTQTSYEFATFISFYPGNLTRLLVPALTAPWILPVRELGVDVGAGGFILAVLAFTSRTVWSRVPAIPLTALVALTMMLGSFLPFYSIYLSIFPPLSVFRVPARADLLVNLCLAVMAGLATLAQQERDSTAKKWARTVAVAALFGIACVAAIAGEVSAPIVRAALAVIGVTALLTLPARGRATGAALAPLLLFAELYSAHHREVPIDNGPRHEAQGGFDSLPVAPAGEYRVLIPFENLLGRGLRFGYEEANGYAPLMLSRYYQLMGALASLPPDPLRRHRLSTAIAEVPHSSFGQLLNIRYSQNLQRAWHEYQPPEFLPRARFVDDVVVEPDPSRQLTLLAAGAVPPSSMAVLGSLPPLLSSLKAAGPGGSEPPRIAEAQIVTYEPERIAVRVRTERPRLLVFSELSYPGWRAEIDGRPVPLLNANYTFRAVVVPSDASMVVLTFEPLSLVIGGVASVAALGFMSLVMYRTRRPRGTPTG